MICFCSLERWTFSNFFSTLITPGAGVEGFGGEDSAF